MLGRMTRARWDVGQEYSLVVEAEGEKEKKKERKKPTRRVTRAVADLTGLAGSGAERKSADLCDVGVWRGESRSSRNLIHPNIHLGLLVFWSSGVAEVAFSPASALASLSSS